MVTETHEIEISVRRILTALVLPEDSADDNFTETPHRVALMLQHFRQPINLEEILATGFQESKDDIMVVQSNIPFKGLCAHHLLPFVGSAVVGYIPRKRVVGLSKLTRLVSAAGTIKPATQEHITNLIVDAFRAIDVQGAGVITKAMHTCMAVRGVNAPDTITTVSALRGQFLMNPSAREEFLRLAKV